MANDRTQEVTFQSDLLRLGAALEAEQCRPRRDVCEACESATREMLDEDGSVVEPGSAVWERGAAAPCAPPVEENEQPVLLRKLRNRSDHR